MFALRPVERCNAACVACVCFVLQGAAQTLHQHSL